MRLATHLRSVPELRMSGASPLCLHGVQGDNFIYTFTEGIFSNFLADAPQPTDWSPLFFATEKASVTRLTNKRPMSFRKRYGIGGFVVCSEDSS